MSYSEISLNAQAQREDESYESFTRALGELQKVIMSPTWGNKGSSDHYQAVNEVAKTIKALGGSMRQLAPGIQGTPQPLQPPQQPPEEGAEEEKEKGGRLSRLSGSVYFCAALIAVFLCATVLAYQNISFKNDMIARSFNGTLARAGYNATRAMEMAPFTKAELNQPLFYVLAAAVATVFLLTLPSLLDFLKGLLRKKPSEDEDAMDRIKTIIHGLLFRYSAVVLLIEKQPTRKESLVALERPRFLEWIAELKMLVDVIYWQRKAFLMEALARVGAASAAVAK